MGLLWEKWQELFLQEFVRGNSIGALVSLNRLTRVLAFIFLEIIMADQRLGWKVFCGVSCTTITNGMHSEEFGPTDKGGDGTKVPDIEVFIPELMPMADGDKPEDKIVQDITLWNPFTREDEKIQISATNIIRCKYMGAQNFYVPCIHRGEQVWVLQHEGSEFQYYWLPMGRDEGIRRHEHIRWYAHNLPKAIVNGEKTVVTDDNTYFICIDTNPGKDGKPNKLIQIHTSSNDGEEFQYDVRIYPELSKLEICDNAGERNGGGNRIELDSANTKWTIRNIDDSFIKLDKENIQISCKDTVNITAGKMIRVRAGWRDDYVTGAETSVAGNSGVMDVKHGSHIEKGVTKVQTLTASKTVTTPITTTNGNVTINGHETVNSGSTVVPDSRIGGKSFNAHFHGNGNMGAPTTPPIGG